MRPCEIEISSHYAVSVIGRPRASFHTQNAPKTLRVAVSSEAFRPICVSGPPGGTEYPAHVGEDALAIGDQREGIRGCQS